jgi:glutaredoxin
MRVVVVIALFLSTLCGCSKGSTAPSAEASPAGHEDKLPPIPVVTDDAKDLLFSFVDAQGRVQAVPSVAAVPETVKSRVLVVDLKKTPEERQAHRYAFFVDLTARTPEGTYPVSVVSRYDAAKGQVQAPATPPPEGSVIVYSATWCGFCKKTKAWLKEHNVPYIERDVEKTPGAQAELDQKLKAAQVPGGGIPVVDWGGTLVMGFDQAALTRLLAEKGPGPAPSGGG